MKIIRKKTIEVDVWWIWIWWNNPIRIQSMTNTQTSDINWTVSQIVELVLAWSEIVRITVDDSDAAKAVPFIIKALRKKWISIPIVWDFHFNWHILLDKYPDMASMLSKYRINPWNVWTWTKRDDNFEKIIKLACKYKKAVRIWVNSWSLDQDLLDKNMEENSKLKNPKESKEVYVKTMIKSALISADLSMKYWLAKNKIVLSVKMSDVQDMIMAYSLLSEKTDFPLHLWLTEAWWETWWITASSAALWVLLQKWLWDTIRVSITPSPWSWRCLEVEVCKYLLQSMGLRHFRPMVTSCPWCWRTASDKFQRLAKDVSDQIWHRIIKWKKKYKDFENTKIAVMWCIVNGPWEAKMADVWISLPWKWEDLMMPVYLKWDFLKNLNWDNVLDDFMNIIEDYFDRHFRKRI